MEIFTWRVWHRHTLTKVSAGKDIYQWKLRKQSFHLDKAGSINNAWLQPTCLRDQKKSLERHPSVWVESSTLIGWGVQVLFVSVVEKILLVVVSIFVVILFEKQIGWKVSRIKATDRNNSSRMHSNGDWACPEYGRITRRLRFRLVWLVD